MAFQKTEIGTAVSTDPARARAAILDAFRRALGFQGRAATLLNVHEGTLIRWISKLGMREAIKKVVDDAKAAGRVDPRGRGATGRPRSTS